MTPEELLTTTRSVRKRMDLERPVSRELLERCLHLALQAPTGSNRQGWQWVVVTESDLKRRIGELYRDSWYEYAKVRPEYSEDDPRRAQLPRVVSSARHLADHFGEVPVMVIACHEGRVDQGQGNQAIAGLYGSIVPAAWSLMLAARLNGLVSAYTTLHLRYEREVAELLGIPYERCTQAALITIGYPAGGDEFRPAERLPLDTVVHWERW